MGFPGAEVTAGYDLASVGASELNPGPLQLLLPAGEMSQLFFPCVKQIILHVGTQREVRTRDKSLEESTCRWGLTP